MIELDRLAPGFWMIGRHSLGVIEIGMFLEPSHGGSHTLVVLGDARRQQGQDAITSGGGVAPPVVFVVVEAALVGG